MNKKIDISNVVLQTQRLTLRPFELKDLDDLFEYASVEEVGQMAGWQPHQCKMDSLKILKMFMEEKKTFALVKDNKVIGSLGIENYNEEVFSEYDEQVGKELGFVLNKDYWGQGLMGEAVKEVIRFLFDKENLDFILCSAFVDNYQSQRVQEKCGFKRVKKCRYVTRGGELRDLYVSIIKREDYFNDMIK